MHAPTKHRFSVNEYYRMGETGVLPPDARVELLDGEIIDLPPVTPFHSGVTNYLNSVFSETTEDRWLVSIRNPVHLDVFSEPQPDITLVKPNPTFYRDKHPEPSDVYLLIEVADSSLERDRIEKLPRYAQAKIPEAWIINLNDETIEVYRRPNFTVYGSKTILSAGDFAKPEIFPDVSIDIKDLLKR